MSFTAKKFEGAMDDLFLLRGWRHSQKGRFQAIFEMYRLYKFHLDDLKYAIAKLQHDDNFDERTLMFYLRDHKNKRDPVSVGQTTEDYEAYMLREVGPNWKEFSHKCWEFIGECMAGMGSRSDRVDVEKFHKEMAEEFPGLGFDKR